LQGIEQFRVFGMRMIALLEQFVPPPLDAFESLLQTHRELGAINFEESGSI